MILHDTAIHFISAGHKNVVGIPTLLAVTSLDN